MAHRARSLVTVLTLVLLQAGSAADAENWPQWRGPRLDGTSHERSLPLKWDREENIRWRLPLPGPAASTPVVWGDRLFLTSTREGSDELLVLAADRGGKLLWERTLDRGTIDILDGFGHETTAASPSPATDGTHLWVLFGTGKLACLDFDGQVVWETDLTRRYGKPSLFFGLSMSPLLHRGRLILQLLHADAQLVVALDTETGEELWKIERPTDAKEECLHSYASPVPFGDRVLIHGADHITAHSLEDGSEIWRYGTLNPADSYNPYYRLVATPVTDDDFVVVTTAKRGPVFGLRTAGARGRIGPDSDRVAWTLPNATPDVPSPILHDGLVYLNDERGALTVANAEDGTIVYRERVHGKPHRASPVLADGKLYLSGTDGTVSVVAQGPRFELLAQNHLGEYVAASPAISEGTIYLRTHEALYAIALSP